MAVDPKKILEVLIPRQKTAITGFHGLSHWARVWENGKRLATENGANPDVVLLFSLFHDSCRLDDYEDMKHGDRAAEYVKRERGKLFELPDQEFDCLHDAILLHSHGFVDGNITTQTCWDADRLDLGRCGIVPNSYRLGTLEAKPREVIAWATEKAIRRSMPDFVEGEWGVL